MLDTCTSHSSIRVFFFRSAGISYYLNYVFARRVSKGSLLRPSRQNQDIRWRPQRSQNSGNSSWTPTGVQLRRHWFVWASQTSRVSGSVHSFIHSSSTGLGSKPWVAFASKRSFLLDNKSFWNFSNPKRRSRRSTCCATSSRLLMFRLTNFIR
jgi:hypothetical protein